ncbi:MAG: hypothetical protein JWL94_2188 [Microbacteriaceae bacterium]|nr:hypothetical protein [Microbacteriaceae bacterium]
MPEPIDSTSQQPTRPTASDTVKAGWYDDGSGRQRWWNGTQWTEDYLSANASAKSVRAAMPSWFEPTLSTWLVGSVVVVFLLIALVSTGFYGLVMMAGMAGLITALYVIFTGRRSWALIPSRKVAAITLVGCLLATGLGSSAYGSTQPAELVAVEEPAVAEEKPAPTPTPTPKPAAEFTEEAPADPATVTEASEAAAVVVGDTSATDTTALALLATIPVKGKAPKTGYDRTGMFGSAWLDVDRNGCDTRNDILARDLTGETLEPNNCVVLTGTLADKYTGTTINFVHGKKTSTLVRSRAAGSRLQLPRLRPAQNVHGGHHGSRPAGLTDPKHAPVWSMSTHIFR